MWIADGVEDIRYLFKKKGQHMRNVYIDFETYSPEPIKTAGMYRYTEHPDFEILLIGYAIEDEDPKIIDLVNLDDPLPFFRLVQQPDVLIHAHNATFERLCLRAYGFDIPATKFRCSATKALYCGFPEALGKVSAAMKLVDGKLDTGSALIKLFSCPQKDGSRIFPEQYPDKWEDFKTYLKYDVLSEREIDRKLAHIEMPESEIELYGIDQDINDRGTRVDVQLARNADAIYTEYLKRLNEKIKAKYGITSLKSGKQISAFIEERSGNFYESINKNNINQIMEECNDKDVTRVLTARKIAYKTSIAKYAAMLNCLCKDGSAKGLYRFYGANRTGRWAGRIVQQQNLPQNHLEELEKVREDVKNMDLDELMLFYDNIPSILSQLIRTAFIARDRHIFRVADFSAIEARVIAVLANETWRIETFRRGGDIYVTSAARTFNMKESECGKGTPYRQQGKVTELALGYGGWVGAIKTMDRDGAIPEENIKNIILKWRDASPKIVSLWRILEDSAKRAILAKRNVPVNIDGKIICHFYWIPQYRTLALRLPSGRSLHYPYASIKKKTIRYDNGDSREIESIHYMGLDQTSGKWVELDTYGGKLTENLVQAVSRDLLASAMRNVLSIGEEGEIGIVGHIHDELITECLEGSGITLDDVCIAMSVLPDWAKPFDIPLRAEGFNSYFYKKD